jgi:hypothetical protein
MVDLGEIEFGRVLPIIVKVVATFIADAVRSFSVLYKLKPHRALCQSYARLNRVLRLSVRLTKFAGQLMLTCTVHV